MWLEPPGGIDEDDMAEVDHLDVRMQGGSGVAIRRTKSRVHPARLVETHEPPLSNFHNAQRPELPFSLLVSSMGCTVV